MSTKNTKTTDFTLAEAVSCIALYMCGSDGNIDDTEIKVISEHPFFAQFNVISNQQIFLDLMATEKLNEIMSEEMPKSFAGCDLQFKEDLINAMVKIIIADGEIEEGEMTILNFTATIVGLTTEDVNRIMKEENERMSAKIDKMKADNASSTGSKGGCFVATATMGDYDHPIVLDLRAFRDETLKKTLFGKLFIKVYYTFGPYPAAIIAKSKKLRSLSLKYLIEPLHRFVTKN
tara:strand:- start:190 stop:888 length:699 start_codon:yes stop_codon:yes gene_type:complete